MDPALLGLAGTRTIIEPPNGSRRHLDSVTDRYSTAVEVPEYLGIAVPDKAKLAGGSWIERGEHMTRRNGSSPSRVGMGSPWGSAVG